MHTERIYNGFDFDTARSGYFTGFVNDTTFEILNRQLEMVGIDSLTFDSASDCCDGTYKRIIIEYNGKRKVLQSMFPPPKADSLLLILYKIFSNSKIKRSTKFEIEGEKWYIFRPTQRFLEKDN